MCLCTNILRGIKMEFEKLYMFNPFTIQNADSKQKADTYSNLQKMLVENADTGF